MATKQVHAHLQRAACRTASMAYEVAQLAVMEADSRIIDKARELGLPEDTVIALSQVLRAYGHELAQDDRHTMLVVREIP